MKLWTQRNQFTNEQIPLNDLHHILAKHPARQTNHQFSEKAKGGLRTSTPATPLRVGDLVYVKSDRARDRCIVVSIDGEWCFIKKFAGSQLRATSYKVKLSECYSVPPTIPPLAYPTATPILDDDECERTREQAPPDLPPSTPPDLLRPASPPCQAELPQVTASTDTSLVAAPVPTPPPPITCNLPDHIIS